MADEIPISALPAATAVTVNDVFPIVQTDITKKAALQLVVDLVGGFATNFTDIAAFTDFTLTNPASNYYTVDFLTPGCRLNMMPMNAANSPKPGAAIFIQNIGSNNFDIYYNDGSTSLLLNVPPFRLILLTAVDNSTVSGSFEVDILLSLDGVNIARNLNLIGGSLDNAPIGANTASTGVFTSITVTGSAVSGYTPTAVNLIETGHVHTTNFTYGALTATNRQVRCGRINNEVVVTIPEFQYANATQTAQIVSSTALPARFRPPADAVLCTSFFVGTTSITIRCIITTAGIIHFQAIGASPNIASSAQNVTVNQTTFVYNV